MDNIMFKNGQISPVIGDITDLEAESFVFYAQHSLKLGSGFGNAIAIRGGPSIQEELSGYGELSTGEAVVSKAGDMKAKYIIHAVGPRFMEEDMEAKLEMTVRNCLKAAEDKGIKEVAFPLMGVGFYGVPMDLSANVMLSTISDYLNNGGGVTKIKICLLDKRENTVFDKVFSTVFG